MKGKNNNPLLLMRKNAIHLSLRVPNKKNPLARQGGGIWRIRDEPLALMMPEEFLVENV